MFQTRKCLDFDPKESSLKGCGFRHLCQEPAVTANWLAKAKPDLYLPTTNKPLSQVQPQLSATYAENRDGGVLQRVLVIDVPLGFIPGGGTSVLPRALGLEGPLNTLWRRTPGSPWQGANTDAEALGQSLSHLDPGPVLLLGGGGVGRTSREVLEAAGRPVLQVSRQAPASPTAVAAFRPVGLVQATSLGMAAGDPMPFPELLEAAQATARWAVEWIYKEDTAFGAWARHTGLELVSGAALFDAQAEAQSRRFIGDCGRWPMADS